MRTPADRLIRIFTSLRLTVVLLAFAIILVFLGTLAQVDEGLYRAQAHYFKMAGHRRLAASVAVHRHPDIWPHHSVHFAGRLSLGTLLLFNLVAAHIYRFQLTFKKTGIQLAHAGVIVAARRPVRDRHARARIANAASPKARRESYADSPRITAGVHELNFVSNGERARRRPRPGVERRRRNRKSTSCRSPSSS